MSLSAVTTLQWWKQLKLNPVTTNYLCTWCLLCARHMSAQHVPGVDNTQADVLSRNNIKRFLLSLPKADPAPTPVWEDLLDLVMGTEPDWTCFNWRAKLRDFSTRAYVANSTTKTYSSAQQIFTEFCARLQFTPLPVSEEILILFVAELTQTRPHSTIKSYLSAVRHLHVVRGLGNPLRDTVRLDLILRGVQRSKPKGTCPRLPITPQILHIIKSSLDASPGFDSTMLWAACSTVLFGFMQCADFTTPSAPSYDRRANLLASDVAVNSYQDPSVIAVKIKMSKMDQFVSGVTIYVGRTDELCPITVLLNYLAIGPTQDGPLFVLEDSRFRLKDLLVQRVCLALSAQGVDSSSYSGHSFRISAATTVAACGIEDSLIKVLGRWSSSASQLYISEFQQWI